MEDEVLRWASGHFAREKILAKMTYTSIVRRCDDLLVPERCRVMRSPPPMIAAQLRGGRPQSMAPLARRCCVGAKSGTTPAQMRAATTAPTAGRE